MTNASPSSTPRITTREVTVTLIYPSPSEVERVFETLDEVFTNPMLSEAQRRSLSDCATALLAEAKRQCGDEVPFLTWLNHHPCNGTEGNPTFRFYSDAGRLGIGLVNRG